MGLSPQFNDRGFIYTGPRQNGALAWRDSGASRGTPWLLMHGNSGYQIDPARIPTLRTAPIRVINPDLRGTGKSVPAGDLRHNLYPDLARDIETLRRAANVARFNILAWSGGAAIAALYANQYPGRVGRLVAYAPFFATRAEIEQMFATYPSRGQRWADFSAFHKCTDTNKLVDLHNKAILSTDRTQAIEATQYYCRLTDLTHDDFASFQKSKSAREWEILYYNFRIHAHQITHNYGVHTGQIADSFRRIAPNVAVTMIVPAADGILSGDMARAVANKCPDISLITAHGASHDIHDPAAQSVLSRAIRGASPKKPAPRL